MPGSAGSRTRVYSTGPNGHREPRSWTGSLRATNYLLLYGFMEKFHVVLGLHSIIDCVADYPSVSASFGHEDTVGS